MSWQSANIVDWKWKMNLMWPFLASLVHTLSLRLWRFFELIMLIDIQHNIIQSNHDYFRDLIVISKGESKIRTFWLSSNLVLPDILNNSFQKKKTKKREFPSLAPDMIKIIFDFAPLWWMHRPLISLQRIKVSNLRFAFSLFWKPLSCFHKIRCKALNIF